MCRAVVNRAAVVGGAVDVFPDAVLVEIVDVVVLVVCPELIHEFPGMPGIALFVISMDDAVG